MELSWCVKFMCISLTVHLLLLLLLMQEFMLTVKKNVADMERLVEQAESDLGSVSTVKKVLNSVTLPSLFTPVTQSVFIVSL